MELAQFRELAAFSQFESDLDAATKARLERGARIVEMFKQSAYNPIPVEVQTAIMWAVQNNFFDSIEVSKISESVDIKRISCVTHPKFAKKLFQSVNLKKKMKKS